MHEELLHDTQCIGFNLGIYPKITVQRKNADVEQIYSIISFPFIKGKNIDVYN